MDCSIVAHVSKEKLFYFLDRFINSIAIVFVLMHFGLLCCDLPHSPSNFQNFLSMWNFNKSLNLIDEKINQISSILPELSSKTTPIPRVNEVEKYLEEMRNFTKMQREKSNLQRYLESTTLFKRLSTYEHSLNVYLKVFFK